MLKNRIVIAVMVLLFVLGTGAGQKVYAEEEANFELVKSSNQSVQMVAGESRNMYVELRLKDGYSLNPEFSFSFQENSPISIRNVSVDTEEERYSDTIFWGQGTNIILRYTIELDEFAKIGEYIYMITYDDILLEDEDLELPEPGYILMKVSVINEKTPPQVSVVSGSEFFCNAGETVTMTVTMENQGELEALNTYVYADYTVYDDILIPMYTPLTKKIGNMKTGDRLTMELVYKVAEDAGTQRIKVPIELNYKMATGEDASSTAHIYLYVEGKPEPTATPTPLPTATPIPEEAILLVHTVKQYPENPKAGEALWVEFYLENIGTAPVKNLKLILQGLSASGFEPVSPEPYQYIGVIEEGQSKKVKINLKAGNEITPGQNPLTISYSYDVVTSNGTMGGSDSATIYILNVAAAATPTPTPEPTPVPQTALLLLNTVKQSPSKPMAGENLEVSFYLENAGTVPVKNVKVFADGLSSNGFEPVNSEPYQYISEIKAGKKQKVTLTLRVGEEIPEGLNMLNVQYSYEVENSYGVTTETEHVTLYILDVQNPEEEEVTISRPKLMVSDFYTDVEEVKAGNVFDFNFEILNTNDSIDAKNIKVTVTGASSAFSVTAGGNSFFVNEIKAQEKALITINLKASAAVTTGAYPIQIKMEYEYEGMVATATYSGEIVEEEILLQVKENLRPSVENVYVGSWDTPMINQPTTMSFEFYNMGKSTLNNTYVTIEGDFMLSNGSNSYYIGNIAAGMPEYIEFDVVPLLEGDAVGKMIIHMEDSNGDEVTMEKEFTAYVMGEMVWEDPGYMDPGYMDPGYMDPSVPAGSDVAEKPILPLWLFLCIQGAILVIVIPVTRAIRLALYRRKIKLEDAI